MFPSCHGYGNGERCVHARMFSPKRCASRQRCGTGTPVGEYPAVAVRWVMPDGFNFPFTSNTGPIDVEFPARQIPPAKHCNWGLAILKAAVRDGANTIDFPLSSNP